MQDTPNPKEVYRETLKLISSFLLKGESCFLPGIGVLKQQYQSSTEIDYHVLPPGTEIVLERFIYEAQHPIIQEIECYLGLSAEEAKTTWNRILDTIKSELSDNKPVLIPGVGKLEQDAHQDTQFTSFPLEKFYEPVQLTEGLSQKASSAKPIQSKRQSRKKKAFLYIILIIILLLILGTLAYFFIPPVKDFTDSQIISSFKNQEETTFTNTDSSASDTATVVSDTATVLPLDSTQQDITPIETTPANDSIHFAVIFRIFHSIDRSKSYYKKMRGWGHHISVYTKDSVSYLIGYPYYELPADTSKRVKNIRNIYKEKTFVIHPRKQGFSVITFD